MKKNQFFLHFANPRFSTTIQTCMVLVFFGIWLAVENYKGLQHDAVLYSMLALRKIHPLNFQNDLFVAFGSQDQFTLFPTLFSFLLRQYGVEEAAFLLTLTGKILWLGGLFALSRRFANGWAGVLAIACVVFHTRFYDSADIFSYSESFPTPRLLAEGFGMWALAFTLKRQHLPAVLSLLCAIVNHPIISSYVCLVMFFLWLGESRLSRKQKLGGVLLLAAGGALLALSRVSVFSGLFVSYDPLWYSLVERRSSDILATSWGVSAVCRVLSLFLILWLAWKEKLPAFRQSTPIFLAVSATLLLIWLAGNFIWHDRMITQIQPWRCLWLTQILALLAGGCLIAKLWSNGAVDRILASALLASVLQNNNGALALTTLLLGLIGHWAIKRGPKALQEHVLLKVLSFLIPLPQIGITLLVASRSLASDMDLSSSLTMVTTTATILSLVAVFALFFWAHRKSSLTERLILGSLPAVAAGFLAYGLLIWSTPFISMKLSGDYDDGELVDALQHRIPASAIVESENLRWAWIALQRSHYTSSYQIAGAAFVRENAIEGFRRMDRLCEARVPTCELQQFMSGKGKSQLRWSRAGIDLLCKDQALDFIILDGLYNGLEQIRNRKGGGVSLVDCANQRNAGFH